MGEKDGELARRARGFGPLKETAEQDLSAALTIGSVVEEPVTGSVVGEPVVVMATEQEDADLSVAGQTLALATSLSSDSEIF